VIPRAGHNLPQEAPEAVAAAVMKLIEAEGDLRKNPPYDPLTSFLQVHRREPEPVRGLFGTPYNSVPEFITNPKQNPGEVTFSFSGIGTATQLAAKTFKTVAGIEMHQGQ